MSYEFGSVEWMWAASMIRTNLPGQPEDRRGGSYQEVIEHLSALGAGGWDVAACVAVDDWLYWTVRRVR